VYQKDIIMDGRLKYREKYIMDSKFLLFFQIMAFYIVLSYVLFPLGFYYLVEKSLVSAGNGFITGSVLSILLWIGVGRKMIVK
jgi:hypothetical protein